MKKEGGEILYGVYRYVGGVFSGGPVYSDNAPTKVDGKCKEYNRRASHLPKTEYFVEIVPLHGVSRGH